MIVCSSCGATGHAGGARFCMECGNALLATCDTCGAELAAVAKFCPACGARRETAPAMPATAPPPVASRRITSVLFGDLVSFTSLSEVRDQEDVRELLSAYFEECRRIVERYGGTVEKFIGDAVMAVWGVPTAHEDDAERAVRAGLELVSRIEALGGDLGVPELAMRVGIVTGEVAVTIGATQQGMVAGDAVNTAARVQSAAAPGQVWVDETTRLLTTSAISYVDVGSHQMKGKADPVPLWAVRAVVANVGGEQRADGLEAPLVGRDRELRLVKELFHASEESGRPSLLVVSGEAGMGKTRLGWEFEKYTDGVNTTVKWHSGRCLSYGEGVAYYALAEAIRARLRLLLPDVDDTVEEDFGRLLELGLDRYVLHPDERSWLAPRLGALLGVGAIGSFPREDLYAAWTTFLERVGEGAPVTLLIEDAQHADDGLVAFLEHLVGVGTFACFVVLLARPGLLEEYPALATNRRVTIVHLEPLSEVDTGRLLDGLVSGLPDGVRTGLVARAEGVPLYAVETVRSLIDRDLVVPRGGLYVLVDPLLDLDRVGSPPSLQALIAARLDALAPDQRYVLDRASVLGTSFAPAHLAHLCDAVPALDDVLSGLVRLQLLAQETNRFSAEHGHYRFVQGGVRQVAYGMLSRRDRQSAHVKVAELLESDPERTDEVSAVIAQHYLDAADAMPDEPGAGAWTQAAVEYLRRAAERAAKLGSPAEAAGHLATALTRAGDGLLAATVEVAYAESLFDSGRFEATIEHATHAMEVLDGLGAPLLAGRAGAVLAHGLQDHGELTRAVELTRERLELVSAQAGATEVRLDLTHRLVQLQRLTGEQHGMQELLDQEGRLAEEVGEPAVIARSLGSRALHFMHRGPRTPGVVLMTAAADMAREHHLSSDLAMHLVNLNAEWVANDAQRAIEFGREGHEVAQRSGVATVKGFSCLNLSTALYVAGDWDEALVVAQEFQDGLPLLGVYLDLVERRVAWARGTPAQVTASADLQDSEDQGVSAMRELVAAYDALDMDPSGAARMAVRAGVLMFGAVNLYDDFAVTWQAGADLVWEVGDLAAVDELLAVVDGVTDRSLPAGVRAAHSHLHGLRAITTEAEPAEVERRFRDALDAARSWHSRPTIAQCQESLGTWLSTQGRPDEAAPLIAAAREECERLGAGRWLRRLEAALVEASV